MISGLQLLEYFNNKYDAKKEISYTLNPLSSSKGPLRSMQKFAVILLTTIGSDPIRPWFGTKLGLLNRMNISNKPELELFIQEECKSAIAQFFELQAHESTQNNQTGQDVIQGLELVGLNISNDNQISLIFKLTPLRYSAMTFTMNL